MTLEPSSPKRRLVVSFDEEESMPSSSMPTAPAESAAPFDAPPVLRPPIPGWSPPTAEAVVAAPPAAWAPPPAPASSVVYAGWWQRAGAIMIDGLVIAAVALLFALVVGAALGGGLGWLVAYLLYYLFALVASLIYYPIMLGRSGQRSGQTLGKQVVGIRVQHVNGSPVTGGQAVLREIVMRQVLIGGVGSILLFVPPLLDVLWPLWEPQRRSLHDLGASTVVVRCATEISRAAP